MPHRPPLALRPAAISTTVSRSARQGAATTARPVADASQMSQCVIRATLTIFKCTAATPTSTTSQIQPSPPLAPLGIPACSVPSAATHPGA